MADCNAEDWCWGLVHDRALTYAVAVAARSVTEFGVAGPAVTRELHRVKEDVKEELRSEGKR